MKPPTPPTPYVFQPAATQPVAKLRIISNTWVYGGDYSTGGVSLDSCPKRLPVLSSPRRILAGVDVTPEDKVFPKRKATLPTMLPRLAGSMQSVDETVLNTQGVYAERVVEMLVPAEKPFYMRVNRQGVDVVAITADVCPAQTRQYLFEPNGQYEARIGLDGNSCMFQVYSLANDPNAARWTQLSDVRSRMPGCQ